MDTEACWTQNVWVHSNYGVVESSSSGVSVRLDRRRVESVSAEEIEEFSQQSASTPTPENGLRPVALPGCRRLSESLQKLGDRRDAVEEDDNFTDATQAAPMCVATYACHWSRFLNRSSTCPKTNEAVPVLVADPAILQQPTSHELRDDQEPKPIPSVLLMDTQPGVCLDLSQPPPGHWATPAILSTVQAELVELAELEALNAAAGTRGSTGDVVDSSVHLISSSDDIPLAQPPPPLRGDDIDGCPSSAGSSIEGTAELDPGDVVEAASLIFIHEVVRRAVCHGGSTVSVEILRKALCESWDLDFHHDAYQLVTKVSACDRKHALLVSHLEAKRSRKRSRSQSVSVSTPKRRSNW